MKSGYKKHLLMLLGVWAVTFLTCVLAYIFVVTPQHKAKDDCLRQLEESKQFYESALIASKPETQDKLSEELNKLQDKLEGFVSEPEDSANLTFDIGRIGNEKSLASFEVKAADNQKTTEVDENQYIQENKIQVRFEADFLQFATFINALERNRPVVFIDRFRIVRSTDGTSGHKVDMDIATFVKKKQQS